MIFSGRLVRSSHFNGWRPDTSKTVLFDAVPSTHSHRNQEFFRSVQKRGTSWLGYYDTEWGFGWLLLWKNRNFVEWSISEKERGKGGGVHVEERIQSRSRNRSIRASGWVTSRSRMVEMTEWNRTQRQAVIIELKVIRSAWASSSASPSFPAGIRAATFQWACKTGLARRRCKLAFMCTWAGTITGRQVNRNESWSLVWRCHESEWSMRDVIQATVDLPRSSLRTYPVVTSFVRMRMLSLQKKYCRLLFSMVPVRC